MKDIAVADFSSKITILMHYTDHNHLCYRLSLDLTLSLCFSFDFFFLQPGTIEQAVNDIRTVALPSEDGEVLSVWLLAE